MPLRAGLVLLLAVCALLALRLEHELRAGRGFLGAAAVALLIMWLLLEAPLAARVASDDARGEDRGRGSRPAKSSKRSEKLSSLRFRRVPAMTSAAWISSPWRRSTRSGLCS